MYLKELVQKNKKDGHVRKYMQIVESRRVNGVPRQKILVNLGRFDTEEGRARLEEMAEAIIEASQKFSVLDVAKDLKADWTKEIGPALVFKRLWEEMGLGPVLKEELSEVQTGFDVKEAIFNMVLNRLTDPSSKRQLTLWEQDVHGIENFELYEYYRALDHLIEHKESIEEGIFGRMKSLLNQDIDIVLFDTTTLVHYGDSDQKEELLARGFSKARRGDLKQVVVGVLMSKEGIPLGHEVFAGNKNDVTCFKEVIDKVSERFKIRKIILVGDRGMISRKNIDYLEEKKYEYILGYRMRTIPKEDRAQILSKVRFKRFKDTELQFKEVSYNGKRLLVCYNRERAEIDQKHREDIIERIRKRISSGKITSIIDNQHYKRFLKIKGEKPKVDEERVKQDELYDGVFVLTTNTHLKGLAVVEAYKDLWQIEAGFRQLKSELEMGPVFHWKDRRIRAHIMICFMAFILRTTLFRKIREKDKKASYLETMAHLKNLRLIQMKLKNKSVLLRTELKEKATLAFRSIGMKIPNRVLMADDLTSVVLRQ